MSFFTPPAEQTFRQLAQSEFCGPEIFRSNSIYIDVETLLKLGVIDPHSEISRDPFAPVSAKQEKFRQGSAVARNFSYMNSSCPEVIACFIKRLGKVAASEQALQEKTTEIRFLADQLRQLNNPAEFCDTFSSYTNLLSQLKQDFSVQLKELRATQKPVWWHYLNSEHVLPYRPEAKLMLSLAQAALAYETLAQELAPFEGVGSINTILGKVKAFRDDPRTKALLALENLKKLASKTANPYYLAPPEALLEYAERVGPFHDHSRLYDRELREKNFQEWYSKGAPRELLRDYLPHHRDLGEHGSFQHIEAALEFNGYAFQGPQSSFRMQSELDFLYDESEMSAATVIDLDPKIVEEARLEVKHFLQEFPSLFNLGQAATRESAHLRSFLNLSLQRIAPVDFSLRLAKALVCGGQGFVAGGESSSIKIVNYRAPSALIKRSPFDLGNKGENAHVPLNVTVDVHAKGILFSGSNMAGKSIAVQSIALAALERQAALPQHMDTMESAIPLASAFEALVPSSFQMRSGLGFFAATIEELCLTAKRLPPGALFFLDEVPAGTDYKDLCAVMVALYESFVDKGLFPIATGHLKRAMQYLEAKGFQTFQMECAATTGDITPTYRPLPGVAEHSLAIERMRPSGFPESAVQLAKRYYRAIMNTEELLPSFSVGTTAHHKEQEVLSSDLNTVVLTLNSLFASNFFVSQNTQRRFLDSLLQLAVPSQEELETRLQDLKCFMGLESATCTHLQQHLATVSKGVQSIIGEISKARPGPIESQLHSLNVLKDAAKDFFHYVDSIELHSKTIAGLRQAFADLFALEDVEAEKVGEDSTKDSQIDKIFSRCSVCSGLLQVFDTHLGVSLAAKHFSLQLPTNIDNFRFTMKDAVPFQAFESHSYYTRSPFLKDAVPQSLEIDAADSITVLLGPNGSGKSVALWTARVNALLALHGLPCSGAVEIGPYKRVLAFFGAQARQGTSYFESALQHTATLCQYARQDSLLIMDELHGSDYFEMAAIQLGVWHHCAEQGATVLADTHLRSALAESKTTLPMQILKTDYAFNPETVELTPFYTLSPDQGMESESLGLAVAKSIVGEDIFKRACEVYRELFNEEPFEG